MSDKLFKGVIMAYAISGLKNRGGARPQTLGLDGSYGAGDYVVCIKGNDIEKCENWAREFINKQDAHYSVEHVILARSDQENFFGNTISFVDLDE